MILLRKINLVLVFVLALNALIAGMLFMWEPGGSFLGTGTAILKNSPFHNFFIPGLVLFVVNGLLAVFTGFVLHRQLKAGPLWLVAQGLLLCGWIFIQMLMLREVNALHLVFITMGIFFICSGLYLYRKT